MKPACTEEKFLLDVKGLQMSIVQDDGPFRIVRFKKPGDSAYHFDLITWPLHLCISGDMGTYVFSRLEDMFEFFRSREGASKLGISPGYWHEKVLAQDRSCGIEHFSPERFEDEVRQALKDSGDDSKKLLDSVEELVLSCAHDGEYEARQALSEFEFDGGRHFQDAWEWDFNEYTTQYLWCLYAIVWGISQYDGAKKPTKGDTTSENRSEGSG